jgi:hypothetical protein
MSVTVYYITFFKIISFRKYFYHEIFKDTKKPFALNTNSSLGFYYIENHTNLLNYESSRVNQQSIVFITEYCNVSLN